MTLAIETLIYSALVTTVGGSAFIVWLLLFGFMLLSIFAFKVPSYYFIPLSIIALLALYPLYPSSLNLGIIIIGMLIGIGIIRFLRVD